LDRLNDIDEIDDLKQCIQQLTQKHSSGNASKDESQLLEELSRFGFQPNSQNPFG